MGRVQADVLESLCRHGAWSRRSGWVWDTESGTKRVLDTLVLRGLATIHGIEYVPTSAGRAVVAAMAR